MTIPASQIANVVPSVLSAGGNALQLVGMILTQNTRVPIGTVANFTSLVAVQNYFGAGSREAAIAAQYFPGYIGATVIPASINYTQYPLTAVGAYLRGGSAAGLTLAQLQAINGSLSISINGSVQSGTINLAAATSFSNAASLIGQTLGIQGPQEAVVNGSIAGTTLTVTSVVSGTLTVGGVLSGTGVVAGTYIVGFISGAGGAGTYQVSTSQTVAAQQITAALPAVTYDSVSGAFVVSSPTVGALSTIAYGSGTTASALFLTQAAGAVLSQGAAAAVPGTFMTALTLLTTNWATFMLAFDPDAGALPATQKLAFAAWNSQQNGEFAFVCWDTDQSPDVANPATASLGYLINVVNNYGGTILINDPTGYLVAGAFCGWAASINFSAINGRTTLAGRSFAGLQAGVTSPIAAANLSANGYNFYGAYATAAQQFLMAQKGVVSGPFAWADSYINQIWLNAQLQTALMVFMTTVNSAPYDPQGYAQIEAALSTVINQGLAFGAYDQNVVLTGLQINQINTLAGANIAPTLASRGWYLLILPTPPAVRAARGSPPMTFFYVDGGSIQQITLASVEVQ